MKIVVSIETESPSNAGIICGIAEIIEEEGVVFIEDSVIRDFLMMLWGGLSTKHESGHYIIGAMARTEPDRWEVVAHWLDKCAQEIRKNIGEAKIEA